MILLLSSVFLLVGSALCLIAAIGVLRLPDFFMRLHAATKAGVAGAGLVLIGVAFAEPSMSMWVKVAVGIAFMLLTTPIAGHLLGRAGYVAGVPLWGGTSEDQLRGILERGDFDSPQSSVNESQSRQISRVVLGVAHGRGIDAAIAHALELSRAHKVELVGLGIIDTKALANVGSVPIGGDLHAAQLRTTLITKARHRMAEAVQAFEQAASEAGVRFSVTVEEGEPASFLRDRLKSGVVLVLPRHAWFDHGLSEKNIDPASRLGRHRIAQVERDAESDTPIVVFG